MVWSLLDVLEHSSECSLAPQHGHRNVTFVLKKNSGSTPKQMDRLRPVFVSFEVKGEKESDDDDQRCVVKAGGRKAGRQVDGGGGVNPDRQVCSSRSIQCVHSRRSDIMGRRQKKQMLMLLTAQDYSILGLTQK